MVKRAHPRVEGIYIYITYIRGALAKSMESKEKETFPRKNTCWMKPRDWRFTNIPGTFSCSNGIPGNLLWNIFFLGVFSPASHRPDTS